MINSKKLKQQVHDSTTGAKNEISHLHSIAKESSRVAQLASDAETVINDIDTQFKEATKLNNVDVIFLFIATALQCARQYLLPGNKYRIGAEEGDKLTKKIISSTTPKKWSDVLLQPVPYDAISVTDGFKGSFGSTGISGLNHRSITLGHDPVLGWIIGPINILSDSLTKSDLSTFKVEHQHIAGLFPGGIYGALTCSIEQINKDKLLFPAAIARQAIHFGSDYFTKQGLPVPLLGTIDQNFATDFHQKHNIDMWGIKRSAAVALLINWLIKIIHELLYNPKTDCSKSMYEVRTRKILSYSNAIASCSNIIYVACSGELGKLDIGGILVTLHRVINDSRFISQLKKEFLEKEFYNRVMGEEYDFLLGEES